jgi:hypothetical protein
VTKCADWSRTQHAAEFAVSRSRSSQGSATLQNSAVHSFDSINCAGATNLYTSKFRQCTPLFCCDQDSRDRRNTRVIKAVLCVELCRRPLAAAEWKHAGKTNMKHAVLLVQTYTWPACCLQSCRWPTASPRLMCLLRQHGSLGCQPAAAFALKTHPAVWRCVQP